MSRRLTTVKILRDAQALITDPADWSSQGWGGGETLCAIEALSTVVVGENGRINVEHDAYQALNRAIGIDVYIGTFNDTHSHAEVMAAFDCAIADAEATEQEFTATTVGDREYVAA